MNTKEIAAAIMVLIIAVICAFISIRQFKEKGFLFNNAYIWASKEDREKMDKKPHYRQSAIVFCLVSVVFIVLGISIIFPNYKIELLDIPLMIGTLVYAIVSSIRIESMKK
jgi:hypothetical protein